ncbi:microsomal dipeptidase homolog [Thermococcus kodakarensis KOD1]|uniref:Microsomal dipeptidase homolog n=1 Tax=Thermococcus kodakarensis (strain ATCC BAA-918 / JCM 12380 / KOD1) TaxID=69014 RepID=Q5JDR5_THEKO|nr:dipeptidase [Thermococcus kodakarensis]WCN27903.1 dipeptidase [Thermococcus kodakarensis]WCN30202.1 dipeptidase [Thermococcus kodakarensis]BAD86229.1 microsomal dipeptidase homolog [Thermococcus kodakarensis KOD1]
MIFDAHSDLPTFVYDEKKSGATRVLERNYYRFFGDKITSRVMAIWTRPERRKDATAYGLEVLNTLLKDIDESDSFELVRNVEEMQKTIREGRVALWLGLEGGEPIGESIELLEVFYRLGLRVLTLTWSLRNAIGDGVFERTNGGLTRFGVEVVGKAEELGIVVDLSHINEAGFWDTLDVTSFPVIASHSNARALCDSPRNLTDEQLKAIAERDGVVGAVAIPSFVDREKPTIEKYVEHIEYMADLIGYEHVGLGFDFVYYLREWGGKSVEGFENESKIPELLNLLHERFSKKEVEGITFKNFERVFERIT